MALMFDFHNGGWIRLAGASDLTLYRYALILIHFKRSFFIELSLFFLFFTPPQLLQWDLRCLSLPTGGP